MTHSKERFVTNPEIDAEGFAVHFSQLNDPEAVRAALLKVVDEVDKAHIISAPVEIIQRCAMGVTRIIEAAENVLANMAKNKA